ncbi:MAG: phenylalanine--tRNA ligase subunit beta [Thermodesulfovibrionales bacterium]
MRVPLSWIKEFVAINASPAEIALRLTMLGLEVEQIEETNGEIIFDISITPNRPDCLSVSGISREIAIAFRKEFREPQLKRPLSAESHGKFKIIIDDPVLCPRYTARIIKNVKVGDSPEWLKKRLEQCDLRSINNIVDITNYILLGYGHPLHAFDLDTLKGNLIRIAQAGKGQKIKTLDGVERSLPEDTLLIWDAERPVAIAGIMGGEETEVRPDTKNILLEAAYFNPSSIRRSSKRLGLKTEASYRFERGTDIEGLLFCTDMAVEFILEIAGGELMEVLDEYPLKFKSSDIKLRLERIKKIIGEDISSDEVRDILQLLGFEIRKEEGLFIVKTLSRRPDINTEIDLIEEVSRIRGYDRIPSIMPEERLSITVNKKFKDIEFIKAIFRAKGYSETINLSFMNIDDLKKLMIDERDERFKAIELRNPLKKEESFLRTNITLSLLNNLRTNIRYGIKEVSLFEISKVFFKKDNELPDERLHLGALYWQSPRPVLWKDNINPYYILREIIDGIFNEFRINFKLKASYESFLHPGQSADIFINQKKIGFLGILSPKVADSLDLKTESPVALFEINLDLLFSHRGPEPVFKAIPVYPYIERDLALVVDNEISAQLLRDLITSYPAELIEAVTIFDYFRGGNIPEGKKSIGLRIRYRAKDRTLTEEEVEQLHEKIIILLIEKTGGAIRS